MIKLRKTAWLMSVVLLISTFTAVFATNQKKIASKATSKKVVVTVSKKAKPAKPIVVLGQGSLFNDDFTDLSNWDFLNGSTASVSGGVLKVTAPTSEGIAMKIKDSVWEKMGKPTNYYIEMLIKPTSLGVGNKNIGIASNISSDNTKWYYAGFNYNNRMQAGDSVVFKGYQNSNDKLKFNTEEDLVYYKWRYEIKDGVINFYGNDLYIGKNTGDGYLGKRLANYTPNKNFTGSFGVYSCCASFEVAAVRVGLLDENLTKLVLETTDTSFPLLWGKFIQRIDNVSATGMRVGDKVDFKVTAFNAKGKSDMWKATSSNSKVLKVFNESGASGETFTIKAVGVGTATVTVANLSDPGSARTLTYKVAPQLSYVPDAYIGIDKRLYPAPGAKDAFTEGEIAITFDSTPKIADTTGIITIHNMATGAVVDTIKLIGDTSLIPERNNSKINVGSQRVRIAGKTLYITPHEGALDYGSQYYVAIPNKVFTGIINKKPFTGFSPAKKTWNFTTQAAPVITGKTITVDGSQTSKANFRTVAAALNYVKAKNLDGAVIEIAPGTYRGLLNFKKDLDVTLKGMGKAAYGTDVVIEYKNGERANSGTVLRNLAYISTAKTFTLVNLTLKNAADKPSYGQAETIYFDNDKGKLIAKNCSFLSNQDTIMTKGYNWFKDCYIEGDTDFIWGYAVVSLFENCKIKAVSPGSYISHARCLKDSKGYVFLNCELEAVPGVSYFARDMSGTETDYDNISFINCTIKGKGTFTWESFRPTPYDVPASALTGWKYYNLKNEAGQPYPVNYEWDYELTKADYEAGFASRALILGKPTSKNGAWVADNAWNPVEP